MRFSIAAQALVGATTVSGLAMPGFVKDVVSDLVNEIIGAAGEIVKALPLNQTEGPRTFTLADFKKMEQNNTFQSIPGSKHGQSSSAASTASSNTAKPATASDFTVNTVSAQAVTCDNPNIRFEWRDYSGSDRTALVDGIKCLMNKPSSGNFSPSQNRYEDFVRLHQNYAPNIHDNSKFLLWHRYFLWSFEQVLRNECGFNRAFVWWDETLDAGAFAKSSMFTSNYFGSLPAATNGAGTCVTDGAFAGITLHIGPGSGATDHCLSRAVDESATANNDKDFENYCLAMTNFPDFAKCWEYGPHGFGHNGIGSVMADVQGSVGDPAFWMHHSYIDRVYRIWQNADASRKTSISGTDINGNALTLDTMVYVGGLAPDVQIRDILDTMNGVMCYRYTY